MQGAVRHHHPEAGEQPVDLDHRQVPLQPVVDVVTFGVATLPRLPPTSGPMVVAGDRSERHLTLAKREEISRGLAAGLSCSAIRSRL